MTRKLSDEEIDAFIRGEGLIEIAVDPSDESDFQDFLKKKGGYLATKHGTFKVGFDLLGLIKKRGFKFKIIGGPTA